MLSHRRSASLVGRLLAVGVALVVAAMLALPGTARGQAQLVAASVDVDSGSRRSVTIRRPDGVRAGDLLLAQFAFRTGDSVDVASAPRDWRPVARQDNGGAVGMWIYMKIATAAEPDTYTWSVWDGTRLAGAILAYRGADTTDPVEVVERAVLRSGTANAPSVTPRTDNARIVAFVALADGRATFEVGAPYVERVDAATQAGPNGLSIGAFDAVRWRAGATGEVPIKATEAVPGVAMTLALRPASAPPPAPAAPGAFNVFDVGTAAGALTGVIRTKIAGQAFTLDAVALNATLNGLLTSFTGTVSIDLLDASDGSGALVGTSGCRSSWRLIRTLASTATFAAGNAGRITLPSITEADAWSHVRVRLTHTPASGAPVVACSSDGFAIRPARFTEIIATDADWLTAGTTRRLSNADASGGVVHAAGAPFRIEFRAVNAAGVVTPGYRGIPLMINGGCIVPASGCTNVGTSAFSLPLVNTAGVLATSAARILEAGTFRLTAVDPTFAAIDASDGTSAVQLQIGSEAWATIGRFVPASWQLTLANAPQFAPGQGQACTTQAAWNHTWVGQPFGWATAPSITVRALGAGGQPLTVVTGSLFKLTPSAISLAWASNAPTAAAFAATGQTVSLGGIGAGTATLTLGTGASFVFNRPTTPVSPFQAVVTLTVSVADASETGVAGNGTIPATTPLVIGGGTVTPSGTGPAPGIGFVGGNPAGANTVLYGRVQVMSAHGDSRRALWVPYEVQAWSGQAWYRNQRDSCTQPAPSTVAFSGWGGGLAACDTSVTAVTRAIRGLGWIQLAPPTAGRIGSVNLMMRLAAPAGTGCVSGAGVATTATATPWLTGPWTSAPAYSSDPSGRANFGRWRVDSLVRREVF